MAEVKNIDFLLDITPGKCLIHGDLPRLQRMVANLLDNAIKYTPEGGKVELAVSSADGLIRVTVRDNGPGISETDQGHIFDRFFRGDGSRSQPGNGLGLSLVRAIVKAHNGSMEVISSPGAGSAFKISFSNITAA
jgi:signal transduction histidine kinase